MDCDILNDAIGAMAAGGVGKMNAFIVKHGGKRSAIVPADERGYPTSDVDAAVMLRRERDLLRAVAKLAQAKARR